MSKCPYCDFNSYLPVGEIAQQAYIDALLQDLKQEAPEAAGRRLASIYIGGGTPSLFSAGQIGRLLQGVAELLPAVPDLEITMEANPGSANSGEFAAYRQAGVNRLSIGVQSFQQESLLALGRAHNAEQARQAVESAQQAGFERINIDLMFGLPGQELSQAEADLQQTLKLGVSHISYYQLTLEPNTRFHKTPPELPDSEVLWQMQQNGGKLLQDAGFSQYEVSAFCGQGKECQHNLNYWRFGDYIGIGAGAHGKLTLAPQQIRRRWKYAEAEVYMDSVKNGSGIGGEHLLQPEDCILEFMMNTMRLRQGVETELFEQTTGLKLKAIEPLLAQARDQGFLRLQRGRIIPTQQGQRYLNDLLLLFMRD